MEILFLSFLVFKGSLISDTLVDMKGLMEGLWYRLDELAVWLLFFKGTLKLLMAMVALLSFVMFFTKGREYFKL